MPHSRQRGRRRQLGTLRSSPGTEYDCALNTLLVLSLIRDLRQFFEQKMSSKEARADFNEIPVITVHKKNLDKYKQRIVDDIKVSIINTNKVVDNNTDFHFLEMQFPGSRL